MEELAVSALDDIIIGALYFNADFINNDADRASVANATPVLDLRITHAGSYRQYRVTGNWAVTEADGGVSAAHDPEIRYSNRRDGRQTAESIARSAYRAEIATAESIGCRVSITVLTY